MAGVGGGQVVGTGGASLLIGRAGRPTNQPLDPNGDVDHVHSQGVVMNNRVSVTGPFYWIAFS